MEAHWIQNKVPELFSLSDNPSYQLSLLKGVYALYVANAFVLFSVRFDKVNEMVIKNFSVRLI